MYSLLVFVCLQFTSEFLIIRELRRTYANPRRLVYFLRFITIVLYFSGSAFWTSIILSNLLYPVNLGNSFLIIKYATFFFYSIIFISIFRKGVTLYFISYRFIGILLILIINKSAGLDAPSVDQHI